jgi:hypothetical protein
MRKDNVVKVEDTMAMAMSDSLTQARIRNKGYDTHKEEARTSYFLRIRSIYVYSQLSLRFEDERGFSS